MDPTKYIIPWRAEILAAQIEGKQHGARARRKFHSAANCKQMFDKEDDVDNETQPRHNAQNLILHIRTHTALALSKDCKHNGMRQRPCVLAASAFSADNELGEVLITVQVRALLFAAQAVYYKNVVCRYCKTSALSHSQVGFHECVTRNPTVDRKRRFVNQTYTYNSLKSAKKRLLIENDGGQNSQFMFPRCAV